MRFFIGGLLFYLLTDSFASLAQSSLFEPYDCRAEVEIINRIEKEKLARETALRDSIQKAEAHLAFLKREEIRLLMEMEEKGWQYWSTVGNYTFGKNRGGLPMITDLNALHPYFRDKVSRLIYLCKQKGIELEIVETFRTHAKQDEYKSMGKKYTRSGAGKSKHQYGLAIDVVPIVNGVAEWHNKALWKRIGIIGEQLGLRWGGRWRYLYDPGHFEWTGGLSVYELANGRFPYIPRQETLYPCLTDDLELLSRYWEQWETEQASYANNDQ
ncbi:MAG: M15 family metallopeptidase [Cyclobacteriaceae bacterium]|nr:M15 family metallopeptidase [Cyclobacteriaceae bacterium]UYN85261.1 MAG: M15 family metallopeptidase [Cyclobacteriaceae bacterium]